MSSNDSRVTVTLTPVALVKASSSAMNSLSSDCTKYFQRSSASCAPFSGFHGAACAQALAHSSRGGPASAPVAARAPCTRVRRFNVVMVVPPLSGGETFSARRVEQVRRARIGIEPDLVARLEIVAFAEDGDDLIDADFGSDLQFGAGGFDHEHLGFGAVLGNDEVFRPDAVDPGPSVAARRCRKQRQAHAAGAFEFQPAVGADRAIEEIHC